MKKQFILFILFLAFTACELKNKAAGTNSADGGSPQVDLVERDKLFFERNCARLSAINHSPQNKGQNGGNAK